MFQTTNQFFFARNGQSPWAKDKFVVDYQRLTIWLSMATTVPDLPRQNPLHVSGDQVPSFDGSVESSVKSG